MEKKLNPVKICDKCYERNIKSSLPIMFALVSSALRSFEEAPRFMCQHKDQLMRLTKCSRSTWDVVILDLMQGKQYSEKDFAGLQASSRNKDASCLHWTETPICTHADPMRIQKNVQAADERSLRTQKELEKIKDLKAPIPLMEQQNKKIQEIHQSMQSMLAQMSQLVIGEAAVLNAVKSYQSEPSSKDSEMTESSVSISMVQDTINKALQSMSDIVGQVQRQFYLQNAIKEEKESKIQKQNQEIQKQFEKSEEARQIFLSEQLSELKQLSLRSIESTSKSMEIAEKSQKFGKISSKIMLEQLSESLELTHANMLISNSKREHKLRKKQLIAATGEISQVKKRRTVMSGSSNREAENEDEQQHLEQQFGFAKNLHKEND